ncbi:MAG TPA: ROK family transcriptional regulator [Kineosporiaceae bacterium]|nr:ROK family transcriptional regulator [Kineosporiaceae bacterium]
MTTGQSLHAQQPAKGPHVLRRINTAAVLRAVRDDSPARLADLMQATGLSRPAVTRAVADLREAGLVVDVQEQVEQSIGRPAQKVRFRAEAGHVVGVDVGSHKILAKVADLSGDVRSSRQVAIREPATGAGLLKSLRTTLSEVLAEAGLTPGHVWAVVVGAPGIVDALSGQVLFAPSIPGWARQPVLAELRTTFACPVLIENDINLAVLAERWRGAAAGADSLVFVHWGARIGTGIIIDGRPYRGASAAAGELGFADVFTPAGEPAAVVVDAAHELGPFEQMVGARAIIELAVAHRVAAATAGPPEDVSDGRQDGRQDGVAAVFAAAADGDPAALHVVDLVADRFARGLAVLLLVLDPREVIIGGGVSRAGGTLLEAIERHLRPRVLAWPRLALSDLGGDAVALGAVRRALDHLEERLIERAGAARAGA